MLAPVIGGRKGIRMVAWYKSLIQWHDTLKSVVQHDVVL